MKPVYLFAAIPAFFKGSQSYGETA